MSFPKAKIHRFNEEMTCAPPPGKYDPKFPDSKVIGAVIEKSKRFQDKKHDFCGSTESLDSVCSRCTNHQSSHNQAIFRTPQMPKKRTFVTPRSAVETSRQTKRTPTTSCKTKKKLNDVFMQDKENVNINKQLDDLEKAHTYQMLGKDQEMASLLNEISELKHTMTKMENSNDILLSNLRAEFETSFNTLSMELEQSKNDLERERNIHQQNLSDFRGQIKILEENIKNCNSMNNELEYQLAQKQNALDEMTIKHAEVEAELKNAKDSIQKILSEHASEIQSLKQRCAEELEGLATAAELNVDLLSRKMEDRLKIIEKEVEIEKKESQIQINCKLEEIGHLVKEKTKLFDSQVVDMLSKLKSMEDDFDKKANELMTSLNVCSEWNEGKLQEQVKTLEELEAQKAANIEQKILIVDLQEKVELLEDEISKYKKQCKKYEVIQNEATKTIQVLSQRLFESESEVEKQNEIRKEMKLRTNALEEKIRSLIHENNQLTSNLNDIKTAIVKEVKEVETVLLGKVENYRKKAVEETQKFRMAIEERQNQIELMMQEIEFYRAKAIETSEYVSLCQGRISSYKEEVKELKKQYSELEVQHNKKMNDQKIMYGNLSEKYEKLLNEMKSEKEKFVRERERYLCEKQDLEQVCNEKVESLKELELTLEETKLKLANAQKEVKKLEGTVYGHEHHIEELALKLDHYTDCAKKSTHQINSLNKEKSELEAEIKTLEEEITEKDLRIESLSGELTESKNYVHSVTEHFVALMNDLTEKDRKCESLLQEMEIKNVNMIQVSEEYERMKALYEAEATKATDLERDLKETQIENERYVDELISELVLEKERCSELCLNLEDLKSQNEEFVIKMRELEEQAKNGEKVDELQNKIKITESNLEDTKMENIDLNNEVEALYKEIEELEKQIEDLKKDKKRIANIVNELNGEKGDLMEMIKQQQEEMELLTNEISRQQEHIDELKQMKNDKLEELKSQFQAEVQNELLMLQQTLEEKQKTVTQLQAKEQDLVYKLKSAEGDLIAGETEKKNMENKLKELTEKMSESSNKYSSMEKRKNEYKAYVVELEKELLSLKEQIVNINEEKEKLKEQNNEETMKVTSLTATIADLECRNRELESIIGPFKEQLMQYETERAELLTKASTTEKELRALELSHAKVLGHQNHRQKIKHVVHLTEQLTELKTELEKLRAENTKLRVTALDAQKEASLKGRRKDKENTDLSPAKPKTSTKVSRQSSPALKERTNAH